MYHSLGTRGRKLIWDISVRTRCQNHLNFIVRYMLSINKINWPKIQTQNRRLSVFKLSFIEQSAFVIFRITCSGIYVIETWGKCRRVTSVTILNYWSKSKFFSKLETCNCCYFNNRVRKHKHAKIKCIAALCFYIKSKTVTNLHSELLCQTIMSWHISKNPKYSNQ